MHRIAGGTAGNCAETRDHHDEQEGFEARRILPANGVVTLPAMLCRKRYSHKYPGLRTVAGSGREGPGRPGEALIMDDTTAQKIQMDHDCGPELMFGNKFKHGSSFQRKLGFFTLCKWLSRCRR